MKLLLSLFLTALAATASAQLANSAALVGTYYGFAFPTRATCSTERLWIQVDVFSDYTLIGHVEDFDESRIFDFDSAWPFFARRSFRTSAALGVQSGLKGRFTTGNAYGTLDLRPDGGCLYTWRAYRRFKFN
jgi:hypothetical protein